MRAQRLISVLMALQRGHPLTAGELAQRLEVSVRTIFRDIDALSSMGVPVYTEAGRGGGIRLVEGYSSDLTGLSPGEAEALALIASPASIGGVRELAMPAHSALDKLAAAVPAIHQLRAQHARGRLLFDTKPWFRSLDASPFLDQLRTLIWKDACIDIRYERSNHEHRDYRVEPHALVVKVDTWYLIGRVQREMRVFRVSRIQTLAPSGTTFARDADFDLQKFWKRWCERFETNPPPRNFAVELNISARGRRRLLDAFGQWLRPRLDPLGERFRGRKPVTLEFDREDTALRVLFEVGAEAEVVKPRALQRKLHAQAAKIVGAAARS
ncbi:MAG TPA: YafY family protein [Steroidobacteraceae bacterium]|nr:YafY family protein [Steroidobacteraceae bacterium]